MSRIDVLIPHYRDVAGLAMSIASVERQTISSVVRVVVYDDGSPGKMVSAVQDLLAESPLSTVLIQGRENRGRPYARNQLIDAIESKYAAWLDAGDAWYPEKLEKQLDALYRVRVSGKNVEDVLVTCHYDWVQSGRKPQLKNQVTDKDQLQALLIGTTLRAYLWTLFGLAETYRSIGYFDLSLSRLQDLDYFLRFVQAGGRLITPSGRAPLCAYYKSDIGRNAREIRKCQSIIFDKYHSVINAYGPRFVANRHYKADLLAARFAISNESWPEAGKYLARAFAARPSRFVNDAVRKGGKPW